MVGPSELRVRRGQGLLTCIGLRAGACVCLFDPLEKVAGMAHVVAASSEGFPPSGRPATFADTAVEALIDAMERAGANSARLVAAVAGGASMTVRSAEGAPAMVAHSEVVPAAVLELSLADIPVCSEDTGGDQDRTVAFDVASGRIRSRLGSGEERFLLLLPPQRELAVQVA